MIHKNAGKSKLLQRKLSQTCLMTHFTNNNKNKFKINCKCLNESVIYN